MGAARLLAKAWGVFCVFAGAYALQHALITGQPWVQAIIPIAVCVLLFGAMGLLFAGGFGVSGNSAKIPFVERLKPDHLAPGFNGIVFIAFAVIIFLVQTVYLPAHGANPAFNALHAAMNFAIPGQRALEDRLAACGQAGGVEALASSVSWLLAFIFLGSAISRIRLAAAIVRLERRQRPELLGVSTLAFVLGLVAVVGIQFLFVGTIFEFLPCSALKNIPGQFIIGLGPMMLAYLIIAAVTDLIALGPEA
jgi:hypothetical protein